MVLTTHRFLVRRVEKDKIYSCTTPLGLRALLQGEFCFYRQGRGLSGKSGYLVYYSVGDTGAASLQGTEELSSAATGNLLRPAAILVSELPAVCSHFVCFQEFEICYR